MLSTYFERRANFRRLFAATEIVANELAGRGLDYFVSQQQATLHFSRLIDGLQMDFDVDWNVRKDGRLLLDVVGSAPLSTNWGARPRKLVILPPRADA